MSSIVSNDVAYGKETVQDNYYEYGARTLLHRWFAFNEREERDIPAMLSLMSDNVRLITTYGEGLGHDAILKMLHSLPKGHFHAHKPSNIKISATGKVSLDVAYTHADPQGKMSFIPLHYEVTLKPRPGLLPQFQSIDIKATGAPTQAQ